MSLYSEQLKDDQKKGVLAIQTSAYPAFRSNAASLTQDNNTGVPLHWLEATPIKGDTDNNQWKITEYMLLGEGLLREIPKEYSPLCLVDALYICGEFEASNSLAGSPVIKNTYCFPGQDTPSPHYTAVAKALGIALNSEGLPTFPDSEKPEPSPEEIHSGQMALNKALQSYRILKKQINTPEDTKNLRTDFIRACANNITPNARDLESVSSLLDIALEGLCEDSIAPDAKILLKRILEHNPDKHALVLDKAVTGAQSESQTYVLASLRLANIVLETGKNPALAKQAMAIVSNPTFTGKEAAICDGDPRGILVDHILKINPSLAGEMMQLVQKRIGKDKGEGEDKNHLASWLFPAEKALHANPQLAQKALDLAHGNCQILTKEKLAIIRLVQSALSYSGNPETASKATAVADSMIMHHRKHIKRINDGQALSECIDSIGSLLTEAADIYAKEADSPPVPDQPTQNSIPQAKDVGRGLFSIFSFAQQEQTPSTRQTTPTLPAKHLEQLANIADTLTFWGDNLDDNSANWHAFKNTTGLMQHVQDTGVSLLTHIAKKSPSAIPYIAGKIQNRIEAVKQANTAHKLKSDGENSSYNRYFLSVTALQHIRVLCVFCSELLNKSPEHALDMADSLVDFYGREKIDERCHGMRVNGDKHGRAIQLDGQQNITKIFTSDQAAQQDIVQDATKIFLSAQALSAYRDTLYKCLSAFEQMEHDMKRACVQNLNFLSQPSTINRHGNEYGS
ncbi:MAG: hypothetical protein R3D66_00905 [Alphaproteobacteria bacterium]